jgi:hypothetical protein
MPTTPRCQCWTPAAVAPTQGGCGATCATIGRSPARRTRRCCIATARTARASIRTRISHHSVASFRLTDMRAMPLCMTAASPRRVLGSCTAEILRCACNDALAPGAGSPATHRRAVRHRSHDPRPTDRGPVDGPPGAKPTGIHRSASLAGEDADPHPGVSVRLGPFRSDCYAG